MLQEQIASRNVLARIEVDEEAFSYTLRIVRKDGGFQTLDEARRALIEAMDDAVEAIVDIAGGFEVPMDYPAEKMEVDEPTPYRHDTRPIWIGGADDAAGASESLGHEITPDSDESASDTGIARL